METIKEKEALMLHHCQEADRLKKEIDAEKSAVFDPMLYKAYYCKHSDSYFFINSISKSHHYPYGISLSYSEIVPEFMVKPQEFTEIPVEEFFEALDRFISRQKEQIQLDLKRR